MRRRPWALLAIALGGLFVLGVAVALIFDGLSAEKDDLSSAVSKAGIGVAFTTVGGAVVALALRFLEDHRWRNQERRRIFERIVAAYNQVKLARRNLKRLGAIDPSERISNQETLRAVEVEELRGTMEELNKAQLQFEAIKREVAQSDLFRRKHAMEDELRIVEDYINKFALSEWEKRGRKICESSDPRRLEELRLRDFDRFFEWNLSKRLDHLTADLQGELFGRND